MGSVRAMAGETALAHPSGSAWREVASPAGDMLAGDVATTARKALFEIRRAASSAMAPTVIEESAGWVFATGGEMCAEFPPPTPSLHAWRERAGTFYGPGIQTFLFL